MRPEFAAALQQLAAMYPESPAQPAAPQPSFNDMQYADMSGSASTRDINRYMAAGEPDITQKVTQAVVRALAPILADRSQVTTKAFEGDVGGAMTEGAKQFGDLAWHATGVPMMMEGAGNVSKGYSEGDPLRAAGGVAQMGVGAIPGASLARGARAAMAPFVATRGRTMATGGTLGGATAVPAALDEAEAQSKRRRAQAATAAPADDGFSSLREAIKGNPALEAKFKLMTDAMVASRASVPNVNKESADKIRAEARTRADTLRNELLAEVDTNRRKDLPFRERFPGAAEMLYGTSMGMAAALPFATTVKKRLGDAIVGGPSLGRQTRRLEAEYAKPKPDARAIAAETDRLSRRLDRYEDTRPILSGAGDFAKNAGMSSALIFEGQAIPEQYDVITRQPGDPVRENAMSELTRPGYYKDRVPASVLGGVTAAGLGMKAGQLVTPGKSKEVVDRAREMLARPTPERRQMVDDIQGYLDGRSAQGGNNGPLNRMARKRPDNRLQVLKDETAMARARGDEAEGLAWDMQDQVQQLTAQDRARQIMSGQGVPITQRGGSYSLGPVRLSAEPPGSTVPPPPAGTQSSQRATGGRSRAGSDQTGTGPDPKTSKTRRPRGAQGGDNATSAEASGSTPKGRYGKNVRASVREYMARKVEAGKQPDLTQKELERLVNDGRSTPINPATLEKKRMATNQLFDSIRRAGAKVSRNDIESMSTDKNSPFLSLAAPATGAALAGNALVNSPKAEAGQSHRPTYDPRADRHRDPRSGRFMQGR